MPAPTLIRFNLLPAKYSITDTDTGELIEEQERSRIIITDDAIHGFIDTFEGPKQSFSYRLDDFFGSPRDGYTALTSEGYTVTFSRAQGCLCGSRLRGFDPFPGLPFVNESSLR